MGNPKFCVGEEVGTRGMFTSEYDSDRTEVVECKYFNDEGAWGYQTENVSDRETWWHENSLRKLPPNEENSFSSLMERLMPVNA